MRPPRVLDLVHSLTNVVVEKERKKAEKQAKFDQKKAKATTAAPAGTSKTKEKKTALKKADDDILPEYVEDTPLGEKKRGSECLGLLSCP